MQTSVSQTVLVMGGLIQPLLYQLLPCLKELLVKIVLVRANTLQVSATRPSLSPEDESSARSTNHHDCRAVSYIPDL
jgi:hypothetical protein